MGSTLEPGEFDFRLVSAGDGAVATLKSSDGVVVLDTVVTPELEREGIARDLVRQVQQARRDAGLDVSDRISLVGHRAAGRHRRVRGRTGTW